MVDEKYAHELSRYRIARRFVAGEFGWGEYNTAAQGLGISVRTLKRDIARAKEHLDFDAWRLKKPGPKQGESRFRKDVISAFEQRVYACADQKLNISKLARDSVRDCRNLGFSAIEIPSEREGRRIVEAFLERDPAYFAAKRYGRRGRHDFGLKQGSLEADRPLQIVCIDHTPLDEQAIVIDDLQYVVRPTFTAAIDIFTGVCLAAFVSALPPNATTVALCMAMMAVPKTGLLKLYGIPGEWEACGLPESLYVDGAAELTSKAIRSGCTRYLIDHWVGVPGRPERRGKMERFFRTINSEVHSWPGTTLSNVQERERHGGRKAAVWSLEEVQRRLLIAVMEYNNETYGGPKMPPIMAWRQHAQSAHVQRLIPRDPGRTFIDFLPYKDGVKLTFDGVTFEGCEYRSGDIAKLRYDKVGPVRLHYDPRNMSHIWIAHEGDFLRIPRLKPQSAPKDLYALRRWRRDKAVAASEKMDTALVDELHAVKARSAGWLSFDGWDAEGPDTGISGSTAPPTRADSAEPSSKSQQQPQLPPDFDVSDFTPRMKP